MIIKGVRNGDGRNLANYLISTTEKTDKAELIELTGFGVKAEDIVVGFISEHVIGDGIQCKKPFFHVAVQNTDRDRALSKAEWILVADRIEKRLGLEGQGRAIALHIEEGKVHAHFAWTVIDLDTMTTRPLPYFKARLKDLARELEIDLGLERVRNHRERHEQRTARTMEEQQGRRLGVDLGAVRAGVLDAWGHADDGRTFAQAISDQGHVLARGDRRDVVIVYAGEHGHGTLALGKRLLGEPVAEIRARMDDLDPALLPSVAEARQRLTQTRGRRLGLGEPDLHSEPPTVRPEPRARGFDSTRQITEQELRLHDGAVRAAPEIAWRDDMARRLQALEDEQRRQPQQQRRPAPSRERERQLEAQQPVMQGRELAGGAAHVAKSSAENAVRAASKASRVGTKVAGSMLESIAGAVTGFGKWGDEQPESEPRGSVPTSPMADDKLRPHWVAKQLRQTTGQSYTERLRNLAASVRNMEADPQPRLRQEAAERARAEEIAGRRNDIERGLYSSENDDHTLRRRR
jgi:hypothetical protein